MTNHNCPLYNCAICNPANEIQAGTTKGTVFIGPANHTYQHELVWEEVGKVIEKPGQILTYNTVPAVTVNYQQFNEALNKAAEGVAKLQTYNYVDNYPSSLARRIPGIDRVVMNPVTGDKRPLREIIIALNDLNNWTREQIADWLDTLDEQPTFRTIRDDRSDEK